MSETNSEIVKPQLVEMTDAHASDVRSKLARLQWSVESRGSARRLDERMKIRELRRELRDAGRSDV